MVTFIDRGWKWRYWLKEGGKKIIVERDGTRQGNQLQAITGVEGRTREMGGACKKDISEGNDFAIQEAPGVTTINRSWKDG